MKERRRHVLQEHTIQMVQRRSLWSSSLVRVGIGTLVLLVPVLFSPPAVASEGRSAPKDRPTSGVEDACSLLKKEWKERRKVVSCNDRSANPFMRAITSR